MNPSNFPTTQANITANPILSGVNILFKTRSILRHAQFLGWRRTNLRVILRTHAPIFWDLRYTPFWGLIFTSIFIPVSADHFLPLVLSKPMFYVLFLLPLPRHFTFHGVQDSFILWEEEGSSPPLFTPWRGSIKNPYPKTPLPSPRNEGGSGHPREGYGWRDLSFNPSISISLAFRQSDKRR